MPSLQALASSPWEVAAVVTNPDRPAGRRLQPRPPAVKSAAIEAGIPVIQPHSVRDAAFLDWLRALAPDACVVVAYGRILPAELLQVPRLGFVNLHFSLLPAYRGAAPVQWAIINGERETGVSVIKLTEGMDEGPILATAAEQVRDDDTAGSLGERLARLGAPLLVRALTDYAHGRLAPRPQSASGVSYAPRLRTEDARIDWAWPSRRIDALVRGTNPEPGAWTRLEGRRLKVFAVASRPGPRRPAGRALVEDGELRATTADGTLALTDVQIEGRRRMPGTELARGLRLPPGASFG